MQKRHRVPLLPKWVLVGQCSDDSLGGQSHDTMAARARGVRLTPS